MSLYDSETHLAQDALTECNAETISSIDDNAANAVRCKNALPVVRKLILNAADWDFARKYGNGAQITNDRTEVWGYKHQQPGDLLRLIGVYDASTGWPYRDTWTAATDYRQTDVMPIPYEHVGSAIYSHIEILGVNYMYNRTDVTAWPTHVQHAVMWGLAAKIGMQIHKDMDLDRYIKAQARAALNEAISTDANEGQPMLPQEASWQALR